MSVVLDLFMQDEEEEERTWMEEQEVLYEEVENAEEEEVEVEEEEIEGDGTNFITGYTPCLGSWESGASSPLPLFSALLQGTDSLKFIIITIIVIYLFFIFLYCYYYYFYYYFIITVAAAAAVICYFDYFCW